MLVCLFRSYGLIWSLPTHVALLHPTCAGPLATPRSHFHRLLMAPRLADQGGNWSSEADLRRALACVVTGPCSVYATPTPNQLASEPKSPHATAVMMSYHAVLVVWSYTRQHQITGSSSWTWPSSRCMEHITPFVPVHVRDLRVDSSGHRIEQTIFVHRPHD